MANDVSYTVIPYNSEAYHEAVAVRHQQLRAPHGWEFTAEELARDADDIHLAALNGDGKVLATVILRKLSQQEIRLRQVAVEAARQNRGYGRGLIAFAEQWAQTNGFAEAVLYAREEAIPYYEQIGYARTEGFFEDRGVRFKRLSKPLSA